MATAITRFFAWMISVLIALFGVTGGVTFKREAPLRVTSYIVVPGVDGLKDFDDSHLDLLTDIIFIGNTGSFDSAGNLRMSNELKEIVNWFKERTAETAPRYYVTIFGPGSVSGTTVEERFESMASEHKKAFDSGVLETNIRNMLEEYALDGVNFDYEFPGTREREKEFSDFLVSLDRTLGDDYLITAALSAGWCHGMTKDAIAVLDSVQLMDYDLWDRTGQHSTIGIGRGTVEEMLEIGFSKEQIDLGLAFYARPTTQDAVWYDYKDYYDKMDRYGFAPDETNGLTASFNTPRDIFLKTYWANRNGLGGVFVWHYACDVPADNGASLFNAIARAKTGGAK